MREIAFAALTATLVGWSAAPAGAQSYEMVGTRAQGMAGAFVAVADDSTATWWNPAGLATGATFNIVFEHGVVSEPETPAGVQTAERVKSSGFSLAYPALGLSYYRLRLTQIGALSPTAAGGQTRQDPGDQAGRVRTLAYTQYGATVGQSIGDHLVVATTVKVLRAGRAVTVAAGAESGLDVGDELEVVRGTHADVDIGTMAVAGRVRWGLSIRNLTQPELGNDEEAIQLKRQARTGIAFVGMRAGPFELLTAAADADLTRTPTAFGDSRRVAGGIEGWLRGRRFGLRGGISSSTVGERRTIASGGVSVAPLRGILIEATRTAGRDMSLRGWSTTVRVTY
jgi:long-chain fatty acid transport protein